jgi:hypothetical protein
LALLQISINNPWPFADTKEHSLYSKFACTAKYLVGAQYFNAEAHVSTESPAAVKNAWIPQPHEDQERTGGLISPSCQGSQAGLCQTRLSRLVWHIAVFAVQQVQMKVRLGINLWVVT